MKRVVLVPLFILVLFSTAIASEPNFAGIKWEDGDDAIIAKIGKIQGFNAGAETRKYAEASIQMCNPDEEATASFDIRKTAMTNTKAAKDASVDTRIIRSGDASQKISAIAFSRSKVTDKLLVINVAFNKNRDSFSRDLGDRIDQMLKKHGLPARIIRDTYQWEVSNVEIDADGSKGIISYQHLLNIEAHCTLLKQTNIQ